MKRHVSDDCAIYSRLLFTDYSLSAADNDEGLEMWQRRLKSNECTIYCSMNHDPHFCHLKCKPQCSRSCKVFWNVIPRGQIFSLPTFLINNHSSMKWAQDGEGGVGEGGNLYGEKVTWGWMGAGFKSWPLFSLHCSTKPQTWKLSIFINNMKLKVNSLIRSAIRRHLTLLPPAQLINEWVLPLPTFPGKANSKHENETHGIALWLWRESRQPEWGFQIIISTSFQLRFPQFPY